MSAQPVVAGCPGIDSHICSSGSLRCLRVSHSGSPDVPHQARLPNGSSLPLGADYTTPDWAFNVKLPARQPGAARLRVQVSVAGLMRSGGRPRSVVAWARALESRSGYEVEDPPSFWEAPVILPKRFRYLALKAYEREIISASKLAELLREDLFELRSKLEAAREISGQTRDAT